MKPEAKAMAHVATQKAKTMASAKHSIAKPQAAPKHTAPAAKRQAAPKHTAPAAKPQAAPRHTAPVAKLAAKPVSDPKEKAKAEVAPIVHALGSAASSAAQAGSWHQKADALIDHAERSEAEADAALGDGLVKTARAHAKANDGPGEGAYLDGKA